MQSLKPPLLLQCSILMVPLFFLFLLSLFFFSLPLRIAPRFSCCLIDPGLVSTQLNSRGHRWTLKNRTLATISSNYCCFSTLASPEQLATISHARTDGRTIGGCMGLLPRIKLLAVRPNTSVRVSASLPLFLLPDCLQACTISSCLFSYMQKNNYGPNYACTFLSSNLRTLLWSSAGAPTPCATTTCRWWLDYS